MKLERKAHGWFPGASRGLDLPAPTVTAAGGDTYGRVGPGGGAAPGPDPSKPPYAVPTMADVEAVPWNGLTVASTFAGGGGSCTGYRMAGYRVAWANEFEPSAAETYAANHPGTALDTRDIRTVTGGEIREAVGREVDVLDGSPPCQSFSMAGQRQKSWGKTMAHADGTTQRSDDLFFEYARILGELRPRAFVAENVKGLVTGAAKGYFKEILAALKAQGYDVRAKVLDAQWLGVPQCRQRVIFVGLRSGSGLGVPPFPLPLPYRYSVAEACPWITANVAYRGSGFQPAPQPADQPAPTITASRGGVELLRRARERSLDSPAPTVTAAGGAGFGEIASRHAREADPADPAPTVLASNSGWSDVAVERRRLTINEVKRICSFPDDYALAGSYDQQWARLGNSVPPVMMRAVAEALAPALLKGPSGEPARRRARRSTP